MAKLTKREFFSLILVIILQFISIAAANMLIPSYGAVIDYYHVDKSVIGLPDSFFVFSSAIMAVIWGYFTDRIDRSKIIFFGAILWSVGTIVTALNAIQSSVGFNILIISRTITGAGMGSVIPVAASIMGDIVPAEQRSGWFGKMAILSSISNGVGQGLSSFLAPLTSMGFRFPFLIISLGSMGVIILLFFIKIPERGSHEEELQSLKDLEMEYLYQLSKKDIKKILTKRTNLAMFIQGFIAIIPGTLVVYFLTTMFSDSSIGLFRILPDDIRLQISTIFAGLVGIGYIFGNAILSDVGDKLYKKDVKYRALFPTYCILIAIPLCILFLIFAPTLDAKILPYADKSMTTILIQIFKLYPQSIPYLIFAFFGSFFSAAGVPARSAILMDVNLPEHRGTVTSLFSLAEQIGKGITLALSYVFLTIFTTYKQMIMVTSLFWLPTAFIWYLISKVIIHDINERSLKLRERTQLTLIDYYFEIEIKADQAINNIHEAKRIMFRDLETPIQKLEESIRIFSALEAVARRKEIIELLNKQHEYRVKAEKLLKIFKNLRNNKDNPNFPLKEKIKELWQKIDEEWPPSDIEKIEILFDSGKLKVVEAEIQRKYDLFRSIFLLKEAIAIFERVELLAKERLVDPEERKLSEDEIEFQEDVKNLIIKAQKTKLDTIDLLEEIERLIEELELAGITKERLVQIMDKAKSMEVPFHEVIVDLIPKRKAQKKVESTLNQIENMFNEYDKWTQELEELMNQ
ncbi:MAG: MFS transporter [Promethearchaeota archaeon]